MHFIVEILLKMMIKDNTDNNIKNNFSSIVLHYFFYHTFNITLLIRFILKYTYANINLVLNIGDTNEFNYIYIISLYKIKL